MANLNIFNIRRRKRIYVKSGCEYSSKGSIKASKVYLNGESFLQSLLKYIGQTITIFTVSGGASGDGFTGVLLEVSRDYIKVLSKPSSPPSLALGSICEIEKSNIKGDNNISLGTMVNIPVDKISAFVHNVL